MKGFWILIVWLFFALNIFGQNQPITQHKSKKPASENSSTEKDTVILNGQQLIKIMQNGGFKCLTTLSGDTIVKYEDYYFNIDFLDINDDGYKDIRVFAFSNTPNQCDNYFFDKVTKKYMLIEGCDLDITLIKGTRLFYSYNSVGCGDANWESHLCKIENWKELDIGYMNANGCSGKENGIKIYKLMPPNNDSDEKLIKEIPIPQLNKKWAFIKRYWTKNYTLFE